MTPEQIEKEKQMFEEYYAKNHVPSIMVGRTFDKRNGYYVREEVQLMWLGWKAAKEQAAEQGGWISVEDKYPESSDTEVNVLLSDGTVRIALYQHFVPFAQTDLERSFTGDICHIDGSEYTCVSFENVTHWQPLPEQPEKE